MNKNGVAAVILVVVCIVLVGLWAIRSQPAVVGPDCAEPPGAPVNVTASVETGAGTLRWEPPTGAIVTTYIVEIGSTPGANNQGTFVVSGGSTSFTRQAPPGTYYVRVYARNACGTSPAAPEQMVVIP